MSLTLFFPLHYSFTWSRQSCDQRFEFRMEEVHVSTCTCYLFLLLLCFSVIRSKSIWKDFVHQNSFFSSFSHSSKTHWSTCSVCRLRWQWHGNSNAWAIYDISGKDLQYSVYALLGFFLLPVMISLWQMLFLWPVDCAVHAMFARDCFLTHTTENNACLENLNTIKLTEKQLSTTIL